MYVVRQLVGSLLTVAPDSVCVSGDGGGGLKSEAAAAGAIRWTNGRGPNLGSSVFVHDSSTNLSPPNLVNITG